MNAVPKRNEQRAGERRNQNGEMSSEHG
jgi:hypothetical protein